MKRSTSDRSAILRRLPKQLSGPMFAAATPRHLAAGEALFLAGDRGDGCYRLERGLLKVVITSPRGEERVLSMLGPGAIAGELAVIDGLPRSASVFAVKDCELSFISRSDFEACVKQHPEIYRYLVEVLASRLRETDEAVAALSFMTIRARVARALLELVEYMGEREKDGRTVIHHQMNQSELAALAGVARENVSRVLSDWKRRKLVARSSRYYTITDVARLEREID